MIRKGVSKSVGKTPTCCAAKIVPVSAGHGGAEH